MGLGAGSVEGLSKKEKKRKKPHGHKQQCGDYQREMGKVGVRRG